MQTVLGILMKLWEVDDATVEETLRWIRLLHETVSTAMRCMPGTERVHAENDWLALLSQAITEFLESKGDQRLLNKRLFNAGRVHGSKMLLGRCTALYFGLSQTHHLFHLLKTQEAKIKFVRHLMQDQSRFDGDLIIRYVHKDTDVEEFASVFPDFHGRTAKRSHDGKIFKNGGIHKRWIHRDPKIYETLQKSKKTGSIMHKDTFMGAPAENVNESPPDLSKSKIDLALPTVEEKSVSDQIEARARSLEKVGENVRAIADEPLETLQMYNDIRIVWGGLDEMTGMSEQEKAKAKWEWNRPYGEVFHFSLLLGDPTDVALFLRMSQREPNVLEQMNFRILRDIFRSDDIDMELLPAVLSDAITSTSDQCARSLRAVACIHQIYASLPGATLAIKILESKQSLSNADWLPITMASPSRPNRQQQDVCDLTIDEDEDERYEHDTNVADHFEEAFVSVGMAAKPPLREKSAIFRKSIRSLQESFQASLMDPFDLSVAQSFSCVLLCDSGVFNIPPSHMDEIMAISSGDSLFIAAPLLSDPAESRSRGPKIKHIMGNIGRAGTALLKSPDDPRIRTVGVEQWYFISGENWDGKRKDMFRDTSLHLWFTGSSLAIDRKNKTLGEKDVELYVLESVVSVHGRGTTECGEVRGRCFGNVKVAEG